MKPLAMGAIALLSMAQAASAAPYNWTGFYAGFNLGVDGGSSTFTDLPSGDGLPWLITGDTFTAKRTGASIGIEAGYNRQISHLVLGIEGDVGYLGGNGRGESQSISPTGAGIFGYIQSGGYVSLRARAGIAMDRVLLFATAGGIVANHRSYMQDVDFNGLTKETGPVGGWIVGGGLEYAVSSRWTAKLDALTYRLATKTVTGADTFAGPTYSVTSKGTIVQLGFDYKF
jgi:outer membrane immunogenic protein